MFLRECDYEILRDFINDVNQIERDFLTVMSSFFSLDYPYLIMCWTLVMLLSTLWFLKSVN